MLKLLLVVAVIYFIYNYMWRDNTLPKGPKDSPFIKKNNSSDQIEDADYTEK